jgi:LytS/YehU family sensor histidine kinase
MIFGWLISIILAVSGYRLYQQTVRLSAQNTAQQDMIRQMEGMLETKLLLSKLNPHFLFNSLNSIQYFIHADDKKMSLLYVSCFAGFLRKMIRLGDEVTIHLKDEAALISDYLILEQFRFPDRFEYEIDLPEALSMQDVPPFLTHYLLEEALYNGVLLMATKGKITVSLKASATAVVLEVTDNGIGTMRKMDEQAMLFSRRIRLFNEKQTRKILVEPRKEIVENGIRLNRAVITIT